MESENKILKADLGGLTKELFDLLAPQLVEIINESIYNFYADKIESKQETVKNNQQRERIKNAIKINTYTKQNLQSKINVEEIFNNKKQQLKNIVKANKSEEKDLKKNNAKKTYDLMEYHITKRKETEANEYDVNKENISEKVKKKAIWFPTAKNEKIPVKIEKLICSVTDDNYINFFFIEKVINGDDSLKNVDYDKTFWDGQFKDFNSVFRINQRTKVNEEHILKFISGKKDKSKIIISRKINYNIKTGVFDSDTLPVGETYKEEVLKRIG